jgi:hypothetical protein
MTLEDFEQALLENSPELKTMFLQWLNGESDLWQHRSAELIKKSLTEKRKENEQSISSAIIRN